MRTGISGLASLIAVSVFVAGCAGAPQAGDGRPFTAVQVYDTDPYGGKYEIVGHLWADSRRASFWIPTYPTRDAAIASMQVEAARMNADALVSVSCVDQRGSTWFRKDEPAFLCYGVAIQLRQRQG
jgi:hypothetical protein